MFLRETHLGEKATQDAPQSLEAVKGVSGSASPGGWAWGQQGQGVEALQRISGGPTAGTSHAAAGRSCDNEGPAPEPPVVP